MTTVSIERKIVEDLFNTKLFVIREEINKILSKWNETSALEFIENTRNGEIEEAEMDAIAMTNLLDNLEKYELMVINLGRD